MFTATATFVTFHMGQNSSAGTSNSTLLNLQQIHLDKLNFAGTLAWLSTVPTACNSAGQVLKITAESHRGVLLRQVKSWGLACCSMHCSLPPLERDHSLTWTSRPHTSKWSRSGSSRSQVMSVTRFVSMLPALWNSWGNLPGRKSASSCSISLLAASACQVPKQHAQHITGLILIGLGH